MDSDDYVSVLLNKNVDGKPCVYQLYTPEQLQEKDHNLYLWVRRCELFVSVHDIMEHFKRLNITISHVDVKHELFTDLTTITDSRGYKWYCCKAPINMEQK